MDAFSALAALIGFGSGHSAAGRSGDDDAATGYTVALYFGLAAAVLGMRSARLAPLHLTAADLGLRHRSGLPRWRPAATVLIYVAVLTTASSLSTTVLEWLHVSGSGVSGGVAPGPAALQVELYHAGIAGLHEEPVLLALVLALAARAQWRWWVTVPLAVLLRLSLHLYLGWDATFVVPWIVAAVLLWRWCPVLWPYVLAHGIYDVLLVLEACGHCTAASAAVRVIDALAITGVLVASAAGVSWLRRGGGAVPKLARDARIALAAGGGPGRP
ncbi:MAG TPA: hypothetical protein VE441_11165 [Mycobacterium sp.]|nr:hypothetical protein [Mycobacterium sp.]